MNNEMNEQMKIAVIGLGLIGGSMAKALKHQTHHYIYGEDKDETVVRKAILVDASMVLVPAKGTAIETVEKIMNLCRQIGFTNIQITTPEEHDKMIAFTSQLAHVVSSAYIQSPTAAKHEGFSAGSYKDLTRVAKLNEDMWTELFLDNREALVSEIDGIAERLSSFSKAIKEGDEDTLHEILKNGRIQKALIDGEVF